MLSLKKLNLKHFHSFFFPPKQAFTLVELIVVISVLGVLATIAFTQVSNVTLSARNSTRMTNLQSISSALNIYAATNGVYPIPDNKTDILYSGTTIWYQWYVKDTAARLLRLSPNSSQDPLNTSTYFSYATNASRTNMQLLGFLEANTTSFKALPATFASDELSTKTPYSKWEELGILYTSGTTTPLSGTSIELNTTTNPYTAYYNSTDSISWTGNLLQNLVISYSHGSGFGSPSTDSCPTGFIPVPGNKDFNQPGFCVMKYEAKVAGGVVNSWKNGHNYSTGEALASTPLDVPVVSLTQQQAIKACKLLGQEYHLITNNEWMTMARNLELNSINWSSGIVGSWYIYNGHTRGYPSSALTASQDDLNGLYGITSGTGEGPTFNNKRTLVFSNGQIIWDLAGNLVEFVNKANTLDWIWHDVWQSAFSSSTNIACPWSSDNNCFELNSAVNSWNLFNVSTGPIGNYSSANGVWMGYLSAGISTNVLVRWWSWWASLVSGIYALYLHFSSTALDVSTGFRCAK